MVRRITYVPQGVCSRLIEIDLDDNGTVVDAAFTGGCHGNSQGLCAMLRGADSREIVARLRGIDCKGKGTSCPDQLARALEPYGM